MAKEIEMEINSVNWTYTNDAFKSVEGAGCCHIEATTILQKLW